MSVPNSYSKENTISSQKTKIPDICKLVRYLKSNDDQIQSTTAAFLQHMAYKNPHNKEAIRKESGVPLLTQMLTSENPSVLLNVTGSLRNLTFDTNLEICNEFEQNDGISAVVKLIKTYTSFEMEANELQSESKYMHNVLENASAILCNLSILPQFHKSILFDAINAGLLYRLLRTDLKPSDDNGHLHTESRQLFSTVFYRNITAVVRNMSCSIDAEFRRKLRSSPSVLFTLLKIISLSTVSKRINTKLVENCICAIRNLSYSLPEIIKDSRHTKHSIKYLSDDHITKSISLKNIHFFGKKKHLQEEITSNMLDCIESTLWQPQTVACLLSLLRLSSNLVTIEAAAGSLQNLTAYHWQPSVAVREEFRIQCGLPVLVELLHAPVKSIAVTAAAALRNLAVDPETLELLGKNALSIIVNTLLSYSNQMVHGTYQFNSSDKHIISLLVLSRAILNNQPQFVRRFVEVDGVQCYQYLLHLDNEYITSHQRFSSTHSSISWLVLDILKMLWKMKELHGFYKQCGLLITDFRPIERRGSKMYPGKSSTSNTKKTKQVKDNSSEIFDNLYPMANRYSESEICEASNNQSGLLTVDSCNKATNNRALTFPVRVGTAQSSRLPRKSILHHPPELLPKVQTDFPDEEEHNNELSLSWKKVGFKETSNDRNIMHKFNSTKDRFV